MKKKESMVAKIERDLDYIEIILDRLMRVGEYLNRSIEDGYSINDEYVLDNLSFQVGQAGEQLAQGKLSKDIMAKYPDIKWDDLRDYRNFITHSYNARKNSRLVSIFTKDVPVYVEQLNEVRIYLLARLKKERLKEKASGNEEKPSVVEQLAQGKKKNESEKQNPQKLKSRGRGEIR